MGAHMMPALGFSTSDPERVVQRCRRQLASLLQARLGFSPPNPAPGARKIWILHGDYQSLAEIGNSTIPVVPLSETSKHRYWLSAALEFQFSSGDYSFRNASIIIFEGDPLDNRKAPLFRAEWACLPSGALVSHAQPHWHVYPKEAYPLFQGPLSELPEGISEFSHLSEEQTPSSRFAPTAWPEADRFHFAMTARWHSHNVDAHVETITEDYLVRWLEGCVLYTCAQLQYVDK